jgi:hypothetical protein
VSRRVAAAVAVVILTALLPVSAAAQAAPPLEARLFLLNPPANQVFGPTTPITLILQVRNISGSEVFTTDGFSATEFWRKLYFSLEGVGTFSIGELHQELKFGTCHYRGDAVLPGPGLQVVAVEVLPTGFAVQYTIDARTYFDLSRPGRYTVTARIPVLTFTASGIITDCNIEFSGRSLVNIGAGAGTGRQNFDLVSNSLEFVVQAGDTVPPTTTVTMSPAPNASGWNDRDVTLGVTAVDDPGGAGVRQITVTLFGAQAGTQVLPLAGGSVLVTSEGTTTAFFNAEDAAGNVEATRSQVIRIDKTPPAVTPPASITVAATETGGARGSNPTIAAFLAGGSAADNLTTAPQRLTARVGSTDVTATTLFPVGTTLVTFRFQDEAGNIGSANASVTVTSASGAPQIAAEIVRTDILNVLFRTFDIKFTNTGGATARNVVVSKFTFKTLAGLGIVFYDPTHSPRLPISLGDLAPGASRTIRVVLVAPVTIREFTMTEQGQFTDPTGVTRSFSLTQTVVRRRDRDAFEERKQ